MVIRKTIFLHHHADATAVDRHSVDSRQFYFSVPGTGRILGES